MNSSKIRNQIYIIFL